MEYRILNIDLSNRSYEVEEIPETIIKQYLGGRGLGSYLLYNLVPAKTNPLGEENHLIFSAGPANGTNLPYSARSVVTTKSPLTDIYLRSSASGTFSHQMKRAGFWAIDIRGIAESPIYIMINNQGVEFRDAMNLWGMETGETQRTVLSDLPAEKGTAAVIGPAGEGLLPYAAIITGGNLYRNFGRGGAGGVMGSKRLKAITISGDGDIKPADMEIFEAVRKTMLAIAREKKDALADWHNYGTVGWSLELMGETGILPTRNWQQGHFEGWRGIDPRVRKGEWLKKNHACAPFCLSTCAQYMEIDEGPYKGAHGNRPEYETVYAFGAQCGVEKYDAVMEANQICSENGLDTISSGVTIGFAMECFERGLIGQSDTDGIELRFGDDQAMIAMLKKIIKQEGFGCQLAKGVRRLSKEIKDSEGFAMHAKGLELCGYECRGLNGQALEYAINNRGGDHSAYGFPTYVELADGSRMNIEGKGEQVKRLATGRITRDSLSVCAFPGSLRIMADDMLPDIVSSLFGEPWSADDIGKVAMRIMCQERLFNMREGITRKDDTLPARLLNESKPDGPTKGVVVPLEELKDDYYRVMSWDLSTGNPTDSVIAKLAIEK